MVFVNARSGMIYNPPLSIGRIGDQWIGLPMFQGGIAGVEYRLTSRLFKMKRAQANRTKAYFRASTAGGRPAGLYLSYRDSR